MTIKIELIIFVCFTANVIIWGDAFAADPVIRSVELATFGDDIGRIGSLYNSTWSVVGKCCPIGQVLRPEYSEEVNGTGVQCRDPLPNENYRFSPNFSPFNNSGMMRPGIQKSQFFAVVGNPCKHGSVCGLWDSKNFFERMCVAIYNCIFYPPIIHRFALEPNVDADEYYLLANGSVFTPKGDTTMLSPGRDYCMEFVPGLNVTVLTCYQPELKVVTADTRLAFYAVGLLTSVPFLLATIVAYSITHQLRDIYGLALCCYSGCLAVAFLSLAILQLGGHLFDDISCNNIAFVIEFSFVACFVWLNVMTIEMWRLFKWYGIMGSAIRQGRPNAKRTFFYYSLWGWGLPAIMIILTLAKNLQPIIPWTYVKRSGEDLPSCWFGLDKSALPYFYGPVGLLVLGNTIVFIITGVKMARTQRSLDLIRLARNEESDREDRKVFRELRLRFVVTLVLSIIMGVNWSMELVSVLTESDLLAWSIFDFVNALEGVLVFGLFVLRIPARRFVWRRVKELIGSESIENADNEGITEMTLLPVSNHNTSSLTSQRLNQ